MTPDIAVGGIVLVLALALNAALAWWGNRTISRIAEKKLGSARHIARELE